MVLPSSKPMVQKQSQPKEQKMFLDSPQLIEFCQLPYGLLG